jgi:outer membrane protein OmpA-like peptidoglycan-associated protein
MSAINTLGLEDIYISTRESNDTWGRPINLGSAINSRGFEISPFLSEDGTALYFASNGHGGLGDADIYCSYRQDESWTSWSKPENMGPPFNSTKFDAYLSKNKKGDFFISSNRGGKYSDIYKISLSEINSVIQNDPAKDTEPSHAQEFASNDSISFPEKWVAFFEFDKFELSQMEHQKLNKFISENLRNSIEYQMCISGYTDDTGTENYNRKLSLKRAKSIYKILRKAGIEKRLIEVEGKGIYPASENQLSTPVLMRRVEIALKAIE